MFTVNHPYVGQTFCSCLPVALAVCEALLVDYPGAQPFEPLTPDLAPSKPLHIVGVAELYEIQPAYLFGTKSSLRFRYQYDPTGATPAKEMIAVRCHVGKIGVEFMSHHHLGLIVALDRAIEEQRTEMVMLDLIEHVSPAERRNLTGIKCPVQVAYVELEATWNSFCMTLEQAKTLRKDIVLYRPFIKTMEREYLDTLRSLAHCSVDA